VTVISQHLNGVRASSDMLIRTQQRNKKRMRNTQTLAIGTILLAAGIGSAFGQGRLAAVDGAGDRAAPGLTLTSPDFEDGAVIPNKYTQATPCLCRPNWNGKMYPPALSASRFSCTIPTWRWGRKT